MLITGDNYDFGQKKTSRLDICLCGFIIILILLGCYLYLIPLLIGAGINYIATLFNHNLCDGITYWCYPLLGLGVYLILLIILVTCICCLVCMAKILGYCLSRKKYTPVYVEDDQPVMLDVDDDI